MVHHLNTMQEQPVYTLTYGRTQIGLVLRKMRHGMGGNEVLAASDVKVTVTYPSDRQYALERLPYSCHLDADALKKAYIPIIYSLLFHSILLFLFVLRHRRTNREYSIMY